MALPHISSRSYHIFDIFLISKWSDVLVFLINSLYSRFEPLWITNEGNVYNNDATVW